MRIDGRRTLTRDLNLWEHIRDNFDYLNFKQQESFEGLTI